MFHHYHISMVCLRRHFVAPLPPKKKHTYSRRRSAELSTQPAQLGQWHIWKTTIHLFLIGPVLEIILNIVSEVKPKKNKRKMPFSLINLNFSCCRGTATLLIPTADFYYTAKCFFVFVRLMLCTRLIDEYRLSPLGVITFFFSCCDF